MRPFDYPTRRQERTERPPQYSEHSRYKPFLRREFNGQCVYCRLPDALMGADTFHVDHYRPQKKFPRLTTEYTNLFYACPACNRRKGAFWPDDADLRAGRRVANSCDDVMAKHLRYSGAEVRGLTRQGRFTVELLGINDDKSVDYRRFYGNVLEGARAKIREVRALLGEQKRVMRQVHSATDLQRLARTRDQLRKREAHLARLESRLDLLQLSGGPTR